MCALLGRYAAYSGKSLPTFRHNLSVRFSGVKKFKRIYLPLKMGLIGCPETSLRNYHYTLPKNPDERSSLVCGVKNSCICDLRICILCFWHYYGNLLRSLHLYTLGFSCVDQSSDIRTHFLTPGQKICDLLCIRIWENWQSRIRDELINWRGNIRTSDWVLKTSLDKAGMQQYILETYLNFISKFLQHPALPMIWPLSGGFALRSIYGLSASSRNQRH
jgi:hypothetical protein